MNFPGENDPNYWKFVRESMRHCKCCPDCCDHPCAGVLAGGVCDAMTCYCEDPDYIEDEWDEDV